MILVDHRAGSGSGPSPLHTLPPLTDISTLCELDSGDVVIPGNGPDGPITVAIELKSLSDLLDSARTGRLQGCDTGQLTRMVAAYDICYLAYYGHRRSSTKGVLQVKRNVNNQWVWVNHLAHPNARQPTRYAFLASMLLSIQWAGIHVEHCDTKGEFAMWLRVLHDKLQKPYSSHKLFRTFNRANTRALYPQLDARTTRCARVAGELSPAIGFDRGVAVAEHFKGSVRGMVNADVDEWEKVDGIGKVIAKDVTGAVE